MEFTKVTLKPICPHCGEVTLFDGWDDPEHEPSGLEKCDKCDKWFYVVTKRRFKTRKAIPADARGIAHMTVCDVMRDVLYIQESDVTESSFVWAGLCKNRDDRTRVIEALEEDSGFELPREDWLSYETVGQLLDFLSERFIASL
jgi:hypothetical protein